MSYSLSTSGGPRDVIPELQRQADNQPATLGDDERANMQADLSTAKSIVGREAADGDQISISISGSKSATDTGFSVGRNFGVYIDKRGRASYAPGAPGTPEAIAAGASTSAPAAGTKAPSAAPALQREGAPAQTNASASSSTTAG